MNRLLLLLTSLTFVTAYGQEVHKCYTHELMQYQESLTPGYLNSVEESFERAKSHSSQDRATVYTIPVVVHLVYNDPSENLDDSVVFNQIDILNASFRRTNADTVNLRNAFTTIVGDSFIEFQLAQIDPNGMPTTGITRTSTTQTSFLGVGGFPAEGVKSATDGGVDPWDQAHYLNIWVCNMSLLGTPFILGYASPPNNLPNWPPGSSDNINDGVVIEFEAFGSNNPNPLDLGGGALDVEGKTSVHEVGHYLGLRHIWADGDCTEEDGIDDTPNADDQSNQDCDTLKNTCTDNIGTLGDLPDMVENYMDYSSEACQNSFTDGQVDLMRGILENERIDLISGNPASTSEVGAFEFNIYPNPSNGVVIIGNLPNETALLKIYKETGQLVREMTITAQEKIEDLKTGLYFIQLSSEAGTVTKKLVIR
ncbi:MAG: hypothetical protein ACI857_001851 [Arenicella sp.]|jgi:hypothetical protein